VRRLPIPVLSILHRRVLQTGGLTDALALEAASKTLRAYLLGCARFQQEVVVQRAIPSSLPDTGSSSFWAWIAAHGHRVDRLTFDGLALDTLHGRLSEQAGVAAVGALGVGCSNVPHLQRLEGACNLEQLRCSGTSRTASSNILQPLTTCRRLKQLGISRMRQVSSLGHLDSLTALTQLGLDSLRRVTNLDPLTALTALSQLELANLPGVTSLQPLAKLTPLTQLTVRELRHTDNLAALTTLTTMADLALDGLDAISSSGLECLSSLRHTLKVLKLANLPAVGTLDPVQLLTSLTCIRLASLSELRQGLGPLTCLRLLRRLGACRVGTGGHGELDLRPLSSMTSLRALELSYCSIPSLLPIVPLRSTLQELVAVACSLQPEDMQGAISVQRALKTLTLTTKCSSLVFLNGLTSLRQLCITCGRTVEGLGPIGKLTALQVLLIYEAAQVSSLVPLGGLPALQQLHLHGFLSLSDLGPLGGLSGLSRISLGCCRLASGTWPRWLPWRQICNSWESAIAPLLTGPHCRQRCGTCERP
jgi:hypothetical protein